MTYDEEMAAGRQSLRARDWRGAYRHFGRAHGLGHDVLRQHVAAHKGLLRTAWSARHPHRVVSQLFLLAAAQVFDRDRSDTTVG